MIRCKISQESVGGSGSPHVPSFSDPRTDIIFQNSRTEHTKDVLNNASDAKDVPIKLEIPR